MIRKLAKSEIPEISDLYEKHMALHFEAVGEVPILSKEYQKRLSKLIDKNFMYVLDDNGIKGFLWFAKEDDEINLEEIFVTENGKGYGSKLMNFLIEFARKEKITRINMDVHYKNNRAKEFFNRFGFTERSIEFSKDLD